jgi:hypothetical protein
MLHMKVILTFILELEDDDYDGWNCNWWTEANSNFLPQFMSMRCTDLVLVYVMVMIMNINIKQITTHITHLSKTFCKIIYADLFSNTESYRPRLKFFSRIMKIHKIVVLQSMFMVMGIFFYSALGVKNFSLRYGSSKNCSENVIGYRTWTFCEHAYYDNFEGKRAI